MASPSELIQRLQATLPVRAWQRYSSARGGVLAGGIAYIAFFSLLPALAVGFTLLGLIIGDDPERQLRVIDAVNTSFGTPVITPIAGAGGIISIDALAPGDALTVTGVIGLLGFLVTGLGWLEAMREGIRAMFGRPTLGGNIVRTKARDLLVLATIGIVLLASAIGGVVVSTATGTVVGWIGLDGSLPGRVLLGSATTLLLLAVDVLLYAVIFQLLSGVQVPRADLWDAALVGGIGLGLLKLFAGLLLNAGGNNPLLAVAGVLFGILVWLNLLSRLTLVAAAWGATVAIDRGHLGVDEAVIAVSDLPAPAGLAAGGRAGVRAPRVQPPVVYPPVVSPRAADRVSVLAGAVLGAAGLVAARTVAGAARSVVAAVRRDDQ